jgi:hypothetical protein
MLGARMLLASTRLFLYELLRPKSKIWNEFLTLHLVNLPFRVLTALLDRGSDHLRLTTIVPTAVAKLLGLARISKGIIPTIRSLVLYSGYCRYLYRLGVAYCRLVAQLLFCVRVDIPRSKRVYYCYTSQDNILPD